MRCRQWTVSLYSDQSTEEHTHIDTIVDKGNTPREPDFQHVTTYLCLIYSKGHMHLTV
jgi:hypothetical protein